MVTEWGNVFLASVTEVKFAQGAKPKKPGSRSRADRDYVYACKRYKKGDFQLFDFMGYFLKIWTPYVRSPDMLKHAFKNNELHVIFGLQTSRLGQKSNIKVEK